MEPYRPISCDLHDHLEIACLRRLRLRVELADGTQVHGFLCEPFALEGARDISHYGGWRAYLRVLAQQPAPGLREVRA